MIDVPNLAMFCAIAFFKRFTNADHVHTFLPLYGYIEMRFCYKNLINKRLR